MVEEETKAFLAGARKEFLPQTWGGSLRTKLKSKPPAREKLWVKCKFANRPPWLPFVCRRKALRQPDFALYCASKETVSNWAFSYSVSEKQIQIFKRQKLLPLCLYAITFILSKAELVVSATHIVVIQASLLESNFFHDSSHWCRLFCLRRGALWTQTGAPGKRRPRKIHFGIFACSNLIITCKQTSTEHALWGVFLQPQTKLSCLKQSYFQHFWLWTVAAGARDSGCLL